ncbi:MAG: MlaD family protein [Candidatus Amulumruptor caecigallinarius]|nr:MlaD family protein [Candidatus Amulumruptor caecigallinarius]MCM1396136.1 MlaD family protein [Candidatus Amulumruptor caecigallinarius]MCM1453864.1 MlaD family protein [bacterium]
MKKIFSKELIIGLCVILTLIILFFGIEFLKGINVFKSTNYYYATFTNVEGLAESAPVTLNGYKIGLVRAINYEYDNPGHIKVEISLNHDLKIPKGSKINLTSDLLGTAALQLALADNKEYYKVGDMLPGVTPAGMMENISKEVLPSVTALIPKVDSLLSAVTAIATDPAVASSLDRLDRVMANLETSTRQLNTTMTALQPIVANTHSISTNLNTVSTDLTEVTGKLRRMPIDSTFNHINAITADVSRATAQLNDRNSSLGQLLYSDGLYNNLNHSVQSLDSLLTDVKRNPKRYISIKLL